MTDSKRWFELECRHCGQRFIDMAKLLFHRCPGQGQQQISGKRRRRGEGYDGMSRLLSLTKEVREL
ncbi:MAG: hypothetical protein ABSA52_23900 [Candidatus Binatia bacterium]|jgi:hypothetical protein